MSLDGVDLATLNRLLAQVLDLPLTQQASWLDALPAEYVHLRPRLQQLLARSASAGTTDFLRTLPKLDRGDDAAGADRAAGDQVGPYRLLRVLGRGGMGTVWLAERADGTLKRLVALKLPLIAGQPQMRERLLRERDLLAGLEHPNIARLYDAGVDAAGQPYLALEYIEGQPIDAYCATCGLDTKARLAVFVQAAQAVAHAHAHLTLHRDLKPSNILVTADGQVRLLDFGVAKLLENGDTRQTELTQAAGHPLTPDYASPEQILGQPLTVASDVYALGVVLFELLTGERPYKLERDSRGALEDAIVATDPRAPSGVVSDRALRRQLTGDLDTIVLKALKKAPGERYVSVSAFVLDLRSYLADEPVSARPDTPAYRIRKFVQRHTRSVAAAATALALIAGLVVFYTVRLAAERDRARLEAVKAAKVSEMLAALLTSADPFGPKKDPSVREVLDEAARRIPKELADQPEVEAEMLRVAGRLYRRLGLNDKAQSLLEQALEIGRRAMGPENERVAEILNDLGTVHMEKEDYTAAQSFLEQALTMRRKLFGREHADVAVTLVELGRSHFDHGFTDRAEPLFREALAIRQKVLGDEHQETATSLNELALLLRQKGDLGEAESLFRRSLAIYRKVFGEKHPYVSTTLNNLALIALDREDYLAAEALLRQSLAIKRETLENRHPEVAGALANLSSALREQGRTEEALAAIQEALETGRDTLGDKHPRIAIYQLYLARVQLAQNQAAAAEPVIREALEIFERAYPANDWRTGAAKSLLGADLTALGRYAEAERNLLEAERVLSKAPGPAASEASATASRLVALYDALGQPEKAAAYRTALPKGGEARKSDSRR
jgi:serine/threonine protein kinase/tetratricopeptide (TPR) repeat protein